MSLSRQQVSAMSSSDMDHTTLRIYVSLVLGMKNNVHLVLKFIFCALCPPVYLTTHAVTHFDTGARHSSRWCKDTMGYTPPLLLFQGGSQLRVSTSSQKHQRYLPCDPAPICPPLSPFPGKVGRGRALHGAHQWESAEGSVLPCVHPREGPFPAERTRETSVPAESRVCGGTCSHALLHRQVSPAHAPSRLRHLGDRRSAPETGRPGYLYFSASPCCHAFLETKLSAISERGSNSFLIQGIPWATSFGCRLYLTFTESI